MNAPKPTPERLQSYIAEYSRRFPDAWQWFDKFRADRGSKDFYSWPSWCYCPLAGAYAILSRGGTLSINQVREVGILGALGAWRVTKGIYRYDPDMFAALWETEMDGNLPVDVLYHLPEWCVYIYAPAGTQAFGRSLYGWFAYLEYDINVNHPELRIVIDDGERLTPFTAHLLAKKTLLQCIADMIAEARTNYIAATGDAPDFDGHAEWLAESFAPLVSVTLYLCSISADIEDAQRRKERPANPAPVKTKRGPRIFAASNPTTWDVGYRIGASLRLARHEPSEPGDGHHASPRPHIRRAHWHSYWTGPRAGERRIVLKWLPPIPIGAGEIVPTIHEVD
jgi:hypothetical protein